MDNYIALLLLVVPGFISRKIYDRLNDQRPVKGNFEETIYSLIFSIFNLITLYLIIVTIFYFTGYLYLLGKATIVNQLNNPHFIALYVVLNLISSFTTACIWKCIQPYYIKLMSRCKNGEKGNEIIISDSVIADALGGNKARLVEIYKEDKFLARGILAKRYWEQGEFYLADAEEEFQLLLEVNNGKLPYKGHYIDIKNGLLIKEIRINGYD